MKKIWLLLLICISNVSARASEPISPENKQNDSLFIHLQDAILLALERNPTVTIQKLNPEIAKTYAREQSALFEPLLFAAGSKNEDKIQRFLGSRPDPFEMTSEKIQYDLGLSETLPTGTQLSAGASITGSISSIYSDQYIGSVSFSVTQSLLNGFGIGYNLAALRSARIDVEISELELKAVSEQVVSDVETAYWDIYLAEQELQIQKKSLELAEKQLNESQERVAVGRLPELELAAVDAEVATRKSAMIDAKSRYEQTRLNFLFLTNPDAEQQWRMIPIPLDKPFIPTDTLDNMEQHEQVARKYRADLQQAELNLKKNQLEITRTKNGLLPKLDLFINLGRTTYASSFKESYPEINSPFYSVAFGLSFDMPVTQRQARAEYARAKHTREQMVLSIENMKRLVQKDVRSAYIEVLRARQQIEATQVSNELQEKKLIAEQEKFRVGKSTNFLVLQAQRDFTESQLNQAQAMVAYLKSLINLYLMEGTLLERRGIQNF